MRTMKSNFIGSANKTESFGRTESITNGNKCKLDL